MNTICFFVGNFVRPRVHVLPNSVDIFEHLLLCIQTSQHNLIFPPQLFIQIRGHELHEIRTAQIHHPRPETVVHQIVVLVKRHGPVRNGRKVSALAHGSDAHCIGRIGSTTTTVQRYFELCCLPSALSIVGIATARVYIGPYIVAHHRASSCVAHLGHDVLREPHVVYVLRPLSKTAPAPARLVSQIGVNFIETTALATADRLGNGGIIATKTL